MLAVGLSSVHPVSLQLEPLGLRFPEQLIAIGKDAPHEGLVAARVAQLQADAFDLSDIGAGGLAVAPQRPEACHDS